MKKIFWVLLLINVLLLVFIVMSFEQDSPPASYLPPAAEGNIQLFTGPVTDKSK